MTCFYCFEPYFTITCPRGAQHRVCQHNEGACPQWYDVGGCFEDDTCALCPRPGAILCSTCDRLHAHNDPGCPLTLDSPF